MSPLLALSGHRILQLHMSAFGVRADMAGRDGVNDQRGEMPSQNIGLKSQDRAGAVVL
jgi:hypothetical protein